MRAKNYSIWIPLPHFQLCVASRMFARSHAGHCPNSQEKPFAAQTSDTATGEAPAMGLTHAPRGRAGSWRRAAGSRPASDSLGRCPERRPATPRPCRPRVECRVAHLGRADKGHATSRPLHSRPLLGKPVARVRSPGVGSGRLPPKTPADLPRRGHYSREDPRGLHNHSVDMVGNAGEEQFVTILSGRISPPG